MAKASDNVFPRFLISEGGSTATPAAGRVTVYAKADGLLYSKDDAGAETALGGGAGGTSLLAITAYAPGSDSNIASTTSTTSADVSAANVVVTFTAPASGNVLVRASALVDKAGTSNVYWQIRESTTVLEEVYLTTGVRSPARREASFYISGISGGSHTYKLGHRVGTGGEQSSIYAGPTAYGPVLLEVWSAP